jgi:hypothetical protein
MADATEERPMKTTPLQVVQALHEHVVMPTLRDREEIPIYAAVVELLHYDPEASR